MYSSILHVTDLSETHFNICQNAVEIARRFDAPLYLLHVIEPPASLQLAQGLGFAEFDTPLPVQQDAILVMQTLGEALLIPQSQQFVEIGSVQQCTLDKIHQLNCNLLIIGAHPGRPTLLQHTARDLSESVECDVLLLR